MLGLAKELELDPRIVVRDAEDSNALNGRSNSLIRRNGVPDITINYVWGTVPGVSAYCAAQ